MSLIEVNILHGCSDKYSSRRQNTYVKSKISLLKIMKELLLHRYCERNQLSFRTLGSVRKKITMLIKDAKNRNQV